jgi:hypothetical protein
VDDVGSRGCGGTPHGLGSHGICQTKIAKRELVVRCERETKQYRAQYLLTLICREAAGGCNHGRTGDGYAGPEKAKECEELHLEVRYRLAKLLKVDVPVLGPPSGAVPSCVDGIPSVVRREEQWLPGRTCNQAFKTKVRYLEVKG